MTATKSTTPASIGGTVTATNTYQQIASSCPYGGIVENTSTTSLIYVDWTKAVTAGGTTLTGGAAALGVASATAAGGKQTIPATLNPVFVYGPSGVVFRGSC